MPQKEGYIGCLSAGPVACFIFIRLPTRPFPPTHACGYMSSQGKTAIDFCRSELAEEMIMRAGPAEERLRARRRTVKNRRKKARKKEREDARWLGKRVITGVTSIRGSCGFDHI